MAEPGDPSNPDDHDDLIGFASPASLEGRLREVPEPQTEPQTESAPRADPEEPRIEGPVPGARSRSRTRSRPDARSGSVAAPPDAVEPPASAGTGTETETETEAAAGTRPVEAGSIFEPSREFSSRARARREPPSVPGGGMGLFAVYALILFSVPTFGVSTVIGLLAVTGRSGPEDPLSRSHFVYQQRTLWAAAVATLGGIILLVAATFALGVPTLFFLACWMVLRGASGVWALKAGRPIANPRGWWI